MFNVSLYCGIQDIITMTRYTRVWSWKLWCNLGKKGQSASVTAFKQACSERICLSLLCFAPLCFRVLLIAKRQASEFLRASNVWADDPFPRMRSTSKSDIPDSYFTPDYQGQIKYRSRHSLIQHLDPWTMCDASPLVISPWSPRWLEEKVKIHFEGLIILTSISSSSQFGSTLLTLMIL